MYEKEKERKGTKENKKGLMKTFMFKINIIFAFRYINKLPHIQQMTMQMIIIILARSMNAQVQNDLCTSCLEYSTALDGHLNVSILQRTILL